MTKPDFRDIFLKKHRRDTHRAKVGFKRYLYREGSGIYKYLLYETYVAVFGAKYITLNTGSYYTETTFRGIQQALKLANSTAILHKENGRWMINTTPYRDGIKINYEGDVIE